MTNKEALQIIKIYKYYQGAEDATDLKCINPDYLEAKSKYEEAQDIVEKDLEILELLHQRIKPDIFGRLCYVPILEERNGVLQDFESEKIWEWVKNDETK